MKGQCPVCQAQYSINDAKIPEKGAYARCPKCQQRIFLTLHKRIEAETEKQIIRQNLPLSEKEDINGIHRSPSIPMKDDRGIAMDDTELRKAEKHVRNAWVAGLICAGFTFLFSLIGAYSAEFKQKYGFDALTFIDVALILLLTFGIYKKSRYSALGMSIYFVICKILAFAETGRFTGGLVSLLFVYLFLRGTIAAFQLHKHAIQSGDLVKKRHRSLVYTTVGSVSFLVLAIVFFVILGALGPGTEVVPGMQLKAEYMATIRDLGILDGNETILYCYSDAFLDFKESFYFFTKKKVVMYNSDFENPLIIVTYSDILDIEFKHNPSFFEDSQISLLLRDGNTLFFPVSSDNEGDKKFYNLLLSTWQKECGITVKNYLKHLHTIS